MLFCFRINTIISIYIIAWINTFILKYCKEYAVYANIIIY